MTQDLNFNTGISPILEKAKHNTRWPGQDRVFVTKIDGSLLTIEPKIVTRYDHNDDTSTVVTNGGCMIGVRKDRTEGNFHVHPAISPILEKAKHNTPWPGQTEVKPFNIIDQPQAAKLAFQKAYEGCLNGLRDYGFDIEFDDVVYFEFDSEDSKNMSDPYPDWVISAMDLVQIYFKLYKEI